MKRCGNIIEASVEAHPFTSDMPQEIPEQRRTAGQGCNSLCVVQLMITVLWVCSCLEICELI